MRYASKKRQKLMRIVALERRQFLVEFPWCWFCENASSECVHEIACGSHREQALKERLAWGSSCSTCNIHHLTDNGDAGEWPLAKQLAVKWINDRKHYDRVGFNRLRGRADNAISQAEVVLHVCRILDRDRKFSA